jgi:branched-subunit amino acid ABC-type transport system permease component
MIPLSVFLLVWLVLLGIHLIFSLITVIQMTRFGIANFGTYASTTAFPRHSRRYTAPLWGIFPDRRLDAAFYIV